MALGRDGEDELLQAAVLEQLLDEEYEKAEPAFMRLIELFSGSRNDRRVMASLLLLYRFLRNHPFYRDWAAEYITADTETPLDETIWSGLLRQRAAEALQYADDLLRDCMDLLGQSNDEMLWEVVTPVIMQDREMLARLMTAVTQEEWDIAMTRMLEASFPQFPRKKWTDAETKDTVLRLRRRAAEAVTELKTKVFLMGETQYREDQQKLAPLMERLCALILEFDSRYAAAKLERRKLDFGDMEHDALALLARPDGTPTALAAELGSRYAEIMLDEYQDTNALQERIFAALTAGGCHRFMVGDVKQSIYGFREACPENFLEKRESYAPAEEGSFPAKIALNANFRTRREITGFTNRLFSRIMTQRTAGMDYLPEDELVSSLPYDYTIGRPVTALVINPPVGTPVADCRKMEAEQAAEEIGILLKAGFTVEENGGRRPVRPGDICILMRSAKTGSSTT